MRYRRRIQELAAELPDSTLQLAGLDILIKRLVNSLPQMQFRLGTYRESRKLDYHPTHESVFDLAKLILAELEHAYSNLAVEPGGTPKRARLAKAEGE